MKKYLFATAAFLSLGFTPVLAEDAGARHSDFDWSGLFAGLHAGQFWGDAKVIDEGELFSGSVNGQIGGGLAGFNWVHGQVVFGVEADFGVSNASGTGGQGDVCEDIAHDLYEYDLAWNGHLRGRVGVPIGNGQIMPFLAGGLAVADFTVTENSLMVGGGLMTGWTAGGGVDVGFSNHLVARAEAFYDDYGTKVDGDYSAALTGWTARAALIFRLDP